VDYFGRVLSSEEYTKDYDRLAAILAMQKSEQGRKANTISVTDEVPIPGGKSSEGSIFEIYRQLDSGKRDKQEKSIMRGIRVKADAGEEDIYAAKMRFKERYEKLLERNIKQMADQFFPKNSAVIKINVELNNQPLNAATPNSMIERITTMILLDQNNKDVVLTPEVREAFMKSIAASISYVKGRDRIDLRWAPKPNEYSKGNLFSGLFSGGSDDTAPSVNLSALPGAQSSPLYLYLGGAVIALLLLVWLLRRRKKDIVAEGGFEDRKSVFDEEEKEGFDDITAPPVDKIKELAAQSPEKVAAVLEKWFQEDQENK
jgi:LPXTG-motif cell wall-anchored protein